MVLTTRIEPYYNTCMNKTELGELLTREVKARKWDAKRLSVVADVAYESARSALAGRLNPTIETTTKLVVAVGYDLVAVPQEAAQ